MKRFNLLFAAILFCQVAIAQQYLIKEGTRPRDTFTFTDIYLYPAFTPGKVNFKNNHVGAGMVNYNRFTGEIDFIKDKDTLALTDPETIKNVTIGNDVFYYQIDIGFFQRMEESKDATLAKKDYLQLADRRRHPNSGSSNTASNGSYNPMISNGGGAASGLTLNMVENVDLIYRRKTEYYFANANGFFLKAEKKNLLRLYRDRKDAINTYLEGHDVDFDNGESLLQLFTAINEMR
jgi:hypothetical protein